MDGAPHYRFPGMDPWLEHPSWWPGVHHDLITGIAWDLSARLAPRYTAKYGMRLVVECEEERSIYPDVAVMKAGTEPHQGLQGETIDPAITVVLDEGEREQAFIEVRTTGPHGRIVTIIEVLSPTNKRPGSDAAEKYRKKQEEVLSSDVHLVEIDLLRAGSHTVAVPTDRIARYRPFDYLVAIRRANRRSVAEVYAIRLLERLPRIPIPLLAGDADAGLDLQAMVEKVYESGVYWNLLKYSQPPVPPLSPADAEWAMSVVSRPERPL